MTLSKRPLEEPDLRDDFIDGRTRDSDHLSKGVKEKGKEEVKMVTSKIIPVEGMEKKTSLKDIPGEIMDRIFCVRPELEVISTTRGALAC